MLKKPACKIVTLEDHYWDRELVATYDQNDLFGPPELHARLYDLGDLRLKELDEAGIDLQVISHAAPSTQLLSGADAIALSRRVNDRLGSACRAHPTRFAGFAVLPTAEPAAAADELSRCVEKLGFKGAMISVMANGEFVDHKRYWPIFARAEALDVPVYLHPTQPAQAVHDLYYADYAADYPTIARAAWGYAVETGTQAVRLVLSGLFEAHPKLKIIIGHLGETLPMFLWRIDYSLKRGAKKQLDFRGVFCRNFWITTSGFFSDPALQCCIAEMCVERILFSVDWPFVPNPHGTRWLEATPLSDSDKAKIASGNAERLLKL